MDTADNQSCIRSEDGTCTNKIKVKLMALNIPFQGTPMYIISCHIIVQGLLSPPPREARTRIEMQCAMQMQMRWVWDVLAE